MKCLFSKIAAATHRAEKLLLIQAADETVIDDRKLTGKLHGITKALLPAADVNPTCISRGCMSIAENDPVVRPWYGKSEKCADFA